MRWQVERVLEAFRSTQVRLSGADVMRLTGLGSGAVYPALYGLEERGVLESEWDNGMSVPRRRLYQLVTKYEESPS